MKISKIVNNPKRAEINGQWDVVKAFNPLTNKVEQQYNERSVELCFVDHVSGADLDKTNLFKNDGISAEDLLSFNTMIADAHPEYKGDKLTVVDGAFYSISKKTLKNSTRPSRFRHATFDKGGKFTFITVVVARESVDTSTVCAGI